MTLACLTEIEECLKGCNGRVLVHLGAPEHSGVHLGMWAHECTWVSLGVPSCNWVHWCTWVYLGALGWVAMCMSGWGKLGQAH